MKNVAKPATYSSEKGFANKMKENTTVSACGKISKEKQRRGGGEGEEGRRGGGEVGRRGGGEEGRRGGGEVGRWGGGEVGRKKRENDGEGMRS